MFWRKTREAIGGFHPVHQELIWEHTASTSAPPGEWAAVLTSLSQHDAVVKRRKWDLPTRTRAVLVPLIRVLSEDVPPQGAISITADLRGAQANEKSGPTRDLPVRRPVRSVTEWFALDPWLRVRAELRDGSVLELAVTDRIRFRKITKVNPRGKYKTKTKTKSVQRISARRTLPPGRSVRRPDVPPPPWIAVRVKKGKREVLSATAKLGPAPGETDQTPCLLMVMTELFRWTAPGGARRTA